MTNIQFNTERSVTKNHYLTKLKNDVLQSKYNLKQAGLYSGVIKHSIEGVLLALKDYDM